MDNNAIITMIDDISIFTVEQFAKYDLNKIEGLSILGAVTAKIIKESCQLSGDDFIETMGQYCNIINKAAKKFFDHEQKKAN